MIAALPINPGTDVMCHSNNPTCDAKKSRAMVDQSFGAMSLDGHPDKTDIDRIDALPLVLLRPHFEALFNTTHFWHAPSMISLAIGSHRKNLRPL